MCVCINIYMYMYIYITQAVKAPVVHTHFQEQIADSIASYTPKLNQPAFGGRGPNPTSQIRAGRGGSDGYGHPVAQTFP